LQITACAPQQLLRIILHKIFDPGEDFPTDHGLSQLLLACPESVIEATLISRNLLKLVRDSTEITYQSAIAFKLAAYLGVSTETLGDFLALRLKCSIQRLLQATVDLRKPPQILLKLSVEADPLGYLQFRFADGAVADWLTQLLTPLPQPPISQSVCSSTSRLAGQLVNSSGRQSIPPSAAIFSVQHLDCSTPSTPPPASAALFPVQLAHARCCSLLWLANQTGLIELADLEQPPQFWQFQRPAEIPWLTPDQRLRCSHPAQRRLIQQFLQVQDQRWLESLQPSSPPQQASLKQAMGLALAVDQADRAIQIWGDFPGDIEPAATPEAKLAVRSQLSDRRSAHLGLLLVAQRLLFQLLTQDLHSPAPAEF
jgi:hypothetical protein